MQVTFTSSRNVVCLEPRFDWYKLPPSLYFPSESSISWDPRVSHHSRGSLPLFKEKSKSVRLWRPEVVPRAWHQTKRKPAKTKFTCCVYEKKNIYWKRLIDEIGVLSAFDATKQTNNQTKEVPPRECQLAGTEATSRNEFRTFNNRRTTTPCSFNGDLKL